VQTEQRGGIIRAEKLRFGGWPLMPLIRGETAPSGSAMSTEANRIHFRRMERREWWLWSAAVTVTLLLTAGLASFLFPVLHGDEEFFSTDLLHQAVRGLLGLVLLFDIYTLYQQLQIHRMRRRLFE
jgi:uncharacterized membrane protein YhaH (DUF805 family)